MANLTFNQLQAQFNRQMLGGETDRVGMLKRVLAALGHPDQRYQIIHIAGTNGKGSTGRMLVSLLEQACFRVGHFNSPAMLDQREQIRVNDQVISEQDFVATYQQILAALPVDLSTDDLTIFEWWTLIMIQYFANQKVDWAVIEVGLGGANDATNCIDAPALAVITHLALDHTQILGPTIEDIARAKAGIIKAGTRAVVLAPHQEEVAKKVIRQFAEGQQVKLIESEKTAVVESAGKPTLAGQPLIVSNRTFAKLPVQLHLLGNFQADNLTTVMAVVDQLRTAGIVLTDKNLQAALAKVSLPGRFQIVAEHPTVILDGAHNPDGARRLVQSIQTLKLDRQPLALVVGFLADKDVRTMVEIYQQVSAQFFVTTPDNPQRSLPTSQLARLMPEATPVINGPTAVKQARQMVGANGTVIVAGSFYLIKDIEALYEHQER